MSVSREFVYNAVDISKITTTFFGKTATIDKCSQFKSYFYSFLVWPITGENFKLNQDCRQMLTKVMAANVSTCSLFSVWLLYEFYSLSYVVL